MKAYFDFFADNGNGSFSVAREIVKKYQDYPIQHFRKMFLQIKKTIQEIDQGRAGNHQFETAGGDEPEEDESETKKAPALKKVDLDEKTGALSIEQSNVKKLTIKYYLIDSEILFSCSPFVKDQAEQFSYVQPYHVLSQEVTQASGTVNIPLPSEVKGKNVVIEIDSADTQKFKTFYSSELEVRIIEDYGELYV